MLVLRVMIKNLLSQEEGQDLVEYALITSAVALGCVAGLDKFGGAVLGVWAYILGQVVPKL